MDRGDIFWVDLNRPAKTRTREQAGFRPAIIIQDEPKLSPLPMVVVVPLTSNIKATRYFGTLIIEPSKQNGLRERSVAMAFQMLAVDRRRIRNKLGSLSADKLIQIENLVCELLGIKRPAEANNHIE